MGRCLPGRGVKRAGRHVVHPRILFIPPRCVNEFVGEVKAAGVVPSDAGFILRIPRCRRADEGRLGPGGRGPQGLRAVGGGRRLVLFRRHPWVMALSEEKMRRGLEFFLRRLRFPPDDIVRHPILLCYSLEKRILPRCAVMSLLKRKGKLPKCSCLIPALLATTSSFLKRYVARYRDDGVPEVLEAYNGGVGLTNLNQLLGRQRQQREFLQGRFLPHCLLNKNAET